jgi:phosphatidylglycerol:prolipoprotein diacylglycerol transferase
MLIYPEINPVAFTIVGFPIYWYGISYLTGLIICYLILLKTPNPRFANKDLISDLIFYAAIGIILGGRIGYILFYFPKDLFTHPLSVLYFFAPGRSFHGGFIGVIVAMYIFAKKYKLPYLVVTDFIAPVVPLGLACGRLGNFVNGELWGRAVTSHVPWAMVFPAVDSTPRHPSQLYQFFLEGVVLFIILQVVKKKTYSHAGLMSGIFCVAYGLIRIFAEFFREPDYSHGFILGTWVTMGHILSIPLIILGLYLLLRAEPK